MFKGITLNNTRYLEDSRCPCCSSEKDKGGRLKLKKRTRYFLKCDLCKYSILGEFSRNKKEKYLADRDNFKV